MAEPRVAVIGAGAWGTTLARLVARVEPVTLLCHSPETAATDPRDRSQRGATPGCGPAGDRHRHSRSCGASRCDGPGDLRGAVGAPAGDGGSVCAAPRAGGRSPLGGQGPGTRHAAADERGRGAGERGAVHSGRGPLRAEPGGRGGPQPPDVRGDRLGRCGAGEPHRRTDRTSAVSAVRERGHPRGGTRRRPQERRGDRGGRRRRSRVR